MAFVLPTFNLSCNVWHGLIDPRTHPPSITVDCQLRGVNQSSGTSSPELPYVPGNYFLFPPLTDIRDGSGPSGTDSLECPAGSGRFYYVTNVDDIGKGFTNEHRYALVQKYPPWPEPIP
jgi:hypothetical protein